MCQFQDLPKKLTSPTSAAAPLEERDIDFDLNNQRMTGFVQRHEFQAFEAATGAFNRGVNDEIFHLREDMRQDMNDLRQEMKDDIGNLGRTMNFHFYILLLVIVVFQVQDGTSVKPFLRGVFGGFPGMGVDLNVDLNENDPDSLLPSAQPSANKSASVGNQTNDDLGFTLKLMEHPLENRPEGGGGNDASIEYHGKDDTMTDIIEPTETQSDKDDTETEKEKGNWLDEVPLRFHSWNKEYHYALVTLWMRWLDFESK